jgi:uncharacterized membrane protein HdeD (DUF308 family)
MTTHVQGGLLPAQVALRELLAKNWWLVLLRGIAGVGFGLLAIASPGLTLVALVLLYGAYALIDGVTSIAAAVANRGGRAPTGWLVFVGVLGIAAGVVTFLWPGITAFALLVLIAVWSILHGVFEIAGAIRLRREIEGEWLLILSGVLSVAIGVVLLARPEAGALALVFVIGAYAILFGSLLIVLSLRLRKHRPAH